MTARPIIFSAPMIRALLAGRKTQTRRVVKPQPPEICRSVYRPLLSERNNWQGIGRDDLMCWYGRCPYGQPGDLLWVKESWARHLDEDHLRAADIEPERRYAWYWADGPGRTCRTGCAGAAGRVRAALFMPRWASRLTLRLTGVRVERVQEISEEDAETEGITERAYPGTANAYDPSDKVVWVADDQSLLSGGFGALWDSLHYKRGYGWEADPWVWVLTFDVIQQNVGAILAEAA